MAVADRPDRGPAAQPGHRGPAAARAVLRADHDQRPAGRGRRDGGVLPRHDRLPGPARGRRARAAPHLGQAGDRLAELAADADEPAEVPTPGRWPRRAAASGWPRPASRSSSRCWCPASACTTCSRASTAPGGRHPGHAPRSAGPDAEPAAERARDRADLTPANDPPRNSTCRCRCSTTTRRDWHLVPHGPSTAVTSAARRVPGRRRQHAGRPSPPPRSRSARETVGYDATLAFLPLPYAPTDVQIPRAGRRTTPR